jgi:hypothetical protein
MNSTLSAADLRHQQRLVRTLEKRTVKLAASVDDIFTPTEPRLPDVLDGFGPGDYSGGYTGQGDTVYWGPSGDGPVQSMAPAVLNSNTRAGGMTELVPIRTEASSSGTLGMKGGLSGAVGSDGIVDGIDFSALMDARTTRLANSIDNVFAEVEPRPATDWSGFDVMTDTSASAIHPKRTFYDPSEWDEDDGGVEMTEFGSDATTASMSSSGDLRFTGDEQLHLANHDTTSEDMSMSEAMDLDLFDSGSDASTFSMGAEQPFTLAEFNALGPGEKYLASMVTENPGMDNDGILRLFEGWDKDADIDARLALKGRSRAENMWRQDEIWSRTRAAIKEGVPLPKVDAMGNTHNVDDRFSDLDGKAAETGATETLRGDYADPAGASDLATNPRTKQVLDMMDTSRPGYTVPRNLDPLFDKEVSMTEMTQLNERPGFTDIAGNMPADAIGGLRQLAQITMDEGFAPKDFLMESGAAINPADATSMMFNPKMLKNYVIKQAKGSVYSLALSPLINWLNDQDTGLGNMVVAGLATFDIINSADPLGAIMFGAQQMIQMFANAHEKTLEDDTPDDKFGTRLGYVREGDTWYPAVYDSKFESTGLLANDGERAMDYGHQLLWGFDGEGDWIPVVPDANNKRFVVNDAVWKDETLFNGVSVTSKEFVTTTGNASLGEAKKMNNIARDWYLLDPRETADVLLGKKKLEAWTQDPTKLNPQAQQINDWRKALDMGHDWKWSSAIQTMGKGAAINSYEGSRELQRLMSEGVDYMTGGLRNTYVGDDYGTYIKGQTDRTGNQDKNVRDFAGDFIYNDVIKDHLEALYRTQRIAAQDAGFEDAFGGKSDATGNVGGKTVTRKDMDSSTGPTVWSAMYLDTAKDLPTAKDANELKSQLDQIEMMNDRTPNQRNYLAQKAQTRYWLQQSTTMGDSEHLMEFLYGKHERQYTGDSAFYHEDPYGMDKLTRTAGQEYNALTGYTGRPGEQPQGFAMPWQNAGEDFLPTLTAAGLEGTKVTDYMSEYAKVVYLKTSEDARTNSAAWARSTANLNPNSMLEGLSVPLGDSGIYGIDDVVIDEGAASDKKTVRWEDETTAEVATAVETPEEAAAAVEKAASGVSETPEGDAGDWGQTATWDDPLSPYEIPGPGWTWDPMNRFMLAPDGTPFDPDYIPDLNKMYELEKELQAGRDANTKADDIKLQTLGFKPAVKPTDDPVVEPARTTAPQSHGADVVAPATHVDHHLGSHHLSSSMGAASWEAVAAYEGHSSGFAQRSTIKVV